MNSATALALRPRRIDDEDAAFARGLHIDVDRAAARHRDEFEIGQAIHDAGGERRQMRDQHFGIAGQADDLIGRAHILLEPGHALDGIAVLHGFVGPWRSRDGLMARSKRRQRSRIASSKIEESMN